MKKYKNYIIAAISIIAFFITICFIPISASKLIPKFEAKFASDFGVKVHMDKLILQLGPMLKVKTPVMHMMYEDGQKFAQFNVVKFYIPWSSIIKNKPVAKTVYARKMIIRVNSDDKYLAKLINDGKSRNFSDIPDLHLKDYNIAYVNKATNEKYSAAGQSLDMTKIPNFKSFKLSSQGDFSIDSVSYINYDVTVNPKFDLELDTNTADINKLIAQVKELDFHADIISDIKLYKDPKENLQASGFINVDNISVMDKNKKDPKSFIYLTLLGDKASVLSNIYAASDKKIYLEGMVNCSDKPVLDLKVKTDVIRLSDLWNKLKIFTEFSYLKGIDDIDGYIDANFSLKGDLSKIKSNGFLKVNGASLRASGIKIDNINSDIDFSNNTINITNAVGYVNNSPILLKGTINNNINLELLMNKVSLKDLCPSSFGVKEGIISLVSTLSGTTDNIIHKEKLQIDNLLVEQNNNQLNIDSLKFDTNKNNKAYINNVLLKTPQTAGIKVPSLNMEVMADKIIVPETNIFMPNSKVAAKAEILNYNNNDIAFNAVLSGFINSTDIPAIKNNSKIYPIKANFNGNKNVQNINIQTIFEKTDIFDEPAILNISSKLEKDILKVDDVSFTGFSGKFSADMKSNLKGSKKLILTGIVENIKAPILKNIRLYTPQQLNLNAFDTLVQLKGDLFINGKYDKPEIVGQVFIQNLYNKPYQISLSNCTADFNKTNIALNAPMVKLNDSTLGVNAYINTDITNAINIRNLNIKSKYINTDNLLMHKDLMLNSQIPITVEDGKFYTERLALNLYGSPVYMTAFSGDLKVSNSILSINNIASEFFNGKLGGSIEFNVNDGKYNAALMARGVSAEPIYNLISSKKDSVSGMMDFDSNFNGNINSKQSINGDIKFSIHNGRMGSLGKIEHLLYAQNVVADNMLRTSLSVVTKALTLKDTGLFKYINGDIKMVNGVADIKSLQSQGPLMALFIKGQYYPETDYAKLVILGRLSDDVLSGLGAFGEFSFNKLMVMLTGEENNKYNIKIEDLEKLPMLTAKNTKEFRAIINGIIDKSSSVLLFNWISYSQKSFRQKEVPMNNIKVPSFIEELPY